MMDDVIITILVSIFASVLALAIIIFVITKIIDHIKRKKVLAQTVTQSNDEVKSEPEIEKDKEKHE